MNSFLPPPVSPLVEEPMAAGGRQNLSRPETPESDE
jgi:hypothetical protein